MIPELGTIEGFYGKTWDWAARAAHVSAFAPLGYRFYHYAPKADAYLRRRWGEPHPREVHEALAKLAAHCRAEGVRFGVGLSPYEIYLDFDEAARAALKRKLAELDALGLDDLAILFDDMRGDLPRLAETQIEIVNFVADHTKAGRLITCPSYYTDDPILDRFFGERPANYLETLGWGLDPAIEIFWTGPKVCSTEIGANHLQRVTETLGRKPFLWDNYPVNDGQRMSPFLHLRAFTGRTPDIAPLLAAHGVNPASQAMLSRIPMLTLEAIYRGEGADAAQAFRDAATHVAGAELAAKLEEDLPLLQDKGLNGMTDEEKAALRNRYAAFDHACAREVIQWLDGEWRITDEIVQAQ
ncbi:MAG: beta-N-acetylglucosaminidase domain-containing protein [Parvibaculum sp.]|nr:beta-N-acetylglucosaminidase domain-containing protein [Parvibaculum sp.]